MDVIVAGVIEQPFGMRGFQFSCSRIASEQALNASRAPSFLWAYYSRATIPPGDRPEVMDAAPLT